jgi:hypothetical protein
MWRWCDAELEPERAARITRKLGSGSNKLGHLLSPSSFPAGGVGGASGLPVDSHAVFDPLALPADTVVAASLRAESILRMQDEPTTPPVGLDGHYFHFPPQNHHHQQQQQQRLLDPRLHPTSSSTPNYAFGLDAIGDIGQDLFSLQPQQQPQRNLAFDPSSIVRDAATTTAGSASTSTVSPTTTSTDFFLAAPSYTLLQPRQTPTITSPERSLALFENQVEEFFRLEDATVATAPAPAAGADIGNGVGIAMGNSPSTKSPFAMDMTRAGGRNGGFAGLWNGEEDAAMMMLAEGEEGIFDLDLRMEEGGW